MLTKIMMQIHYHIVRQIVGGKDLHEGIADIFKECHNEKKTMTAINLVKAVKLASMGNVPGPRK